MDQGLPRPPPGQSRRRPPHPPRPHHRNRHRVLALPPRPPTAPTTSPEADYLTPDPTTRTPLSPLRLALRAHLRDDNGDHARHRYDKIQQLQTRRQKGPLQRAAPGPPQVAVLISLVDLIERVSVLGLVDIPVAVGRA